MRRFVIALLPALALLNACGGASPMPPLPPVPPAPPDGNSDSNAALTLPADDEIIAKVYDPDYSVPDGFFVDERASTPQSYTVHHVLDESLSYELCTDEFSIAQSWEADDNASRSVSGYYVGAFENDRYYEFIRDLAYDDDIGNVDEVTSPGFARVFKCSNTNRDGVDRSLLSGFAGQLNVRPLSPDGVREFAEYLWQFTFFPQRHRVVLASLPVDSATGPGHLLLLAFASRQGTGQCDLVEVVEWRFDAAAETGEMSSQFNSLRRFEAEAVGGTPRLCP